MSVAGRGNPQGKGLVLGEAPGAEEERLGQPFVGASGRLLTEAFHEVRMPVDELWITNVVKERPPNNRTPTETEIRKALPALEEEFNSVDPMYVLTLGNVALRALTGQTGVRRLHGEWIDGIVLPAYHPAYVLRNRAARSEWIRDLQVFSDTLRSAL